MSCEHPFRQVVWVGGVAGIRCHDCREMLTQEEPKGVDSQPKAPKMTN